jgi:hypothetical protein
LSEAKGVSRPPVDKIISITCGLGTGEKNTRPTRPAEHFNEEVFGVFEIKERHGG